MEISFQSIDVYGEKSFQLPKAVEVVEPVFGQ